MPKHRTILCSVSKEEKYKLRFSDFAYSIKNDGIIIEQYMGNDRHVIIPPCIDNMPVIGIGNYAFEDNDDLLSAEFPNTLTDIGDFAFSGCENLKNVNFPDGLKIIGWSAFAGCYSLTNVVFPDNIEIVDIESFNQCRGLKNVTMGKGQEEIPTLSFCDCTNLETVTIGSAVKIIGFRAFANCVSLKHVYYSGSKEQWDKIDDWGENEPLAYAKITYKYPLRSQIKEIR